MLPLEEGSCIYEWIMVDVLVMNIPEERSGRRQDITVCRQRLSIFQDQGNISKRCPRRPKSALLGDYGDFYGHGVQGAPL